MKKNTLKITLVIFLEIVVLSILGFYFFFINQYGKVVFNDSVESYNLKLKYKNIPVLMYHSISNRNNIYTVYPKIFDSQLKYLKENNYSTISLEDLYNYLNNDSKLPDKPIIITFDDGCEDNYTNAYPILKKYGLNAVFFIIAGRVDKNSYYMNSSQLKDLVYNGFEIESHTFQHEHLEKLSFKKQYDTLNNSKNLLQEITGRQVEFIAYPFGQYNNNTINAAKKCGYRMAFSVLNDSLKGDNMYYLHRILIDNHTDIRAILKMSLINDK